MTDDVQRIALNQIPQSTIENDVQLERIQKTILKMKSVNFKPVVYHGKLRVRDVELLEELRLHNRKLWKKKVNLQRERLDNIL